MIKRKLPSKATIIRTGVLILAIFNNALALVGKSPLPIRDETISQVVGFLFTTSSALITWWKNNSFTQAAIEADETFKLLNEEEQ